MRKIYLDVCCLNRPFDLQTQDRVRLEAEAVLLIMRHIESGEYEWVKSSVIDFEISQTPNFERRLRVEKLTEFANKNITINEEIKNRAVKLMEMGLKTYDALHVACAEYGEVEVFLTTDDKILKVGARYSKDLKVKIMNPLHWLEEIL